MHIGLPASSAHAPGSQCWVQECKSVFAEIILKSKRIYFVNLYVLHLNTLFHSGYKLVGFLSTKTILHPMLEILIKLATFILLITTFRSGR
jgi:hypothetical protein